MTDNTVSNALLVVGYGAAIGAALKFVPMWRQKRLRRFLVFEAGTAVVATGLFIRGRPRDGGINLAVLVGLALAWFLTNRQK